MLPQLWRASRADMLHLCQPGAIAQHGAMQLNHRLLFLDGAISDPLLTQQGCAAVSRGLGFGRKGQNSGLALNVLAPERGDLEILVAQRALYS